MTEFSYQLYSSRNFPPLSATLKLVADVGYKQVEGYGALYAGLSDLGALRGELDANGLTMPTAHIGLDMISSDPDRVIEIAGALGLKAVFAPHLAEDKRPADADGWAAFGKMLAETGKPLQDAGLTFGWHNHDFEFIALEGGDRPVDLIMAGGDLALEFDVAWAAVAGMDPAACIDRYAGRIAAAHIKDIAPDGQALDEDGWADVGHGTMDWAGLMTALREAGCHYFVMEHDNPSDDSRFARRSLAAAQAM